MATRDRERLRGPTPASGVEELRPGSEHVARWTEHRIQLPVCPLLSEVSLAGARPRPVCGGGFAPRELSDDARGDLKGVLTDCGLERALTTLADHATVPVELRVALHNPRLAMSVEAAAYFTVCEALTNVAKHARDSCLGRRRAARRPSRRRSWATAAQVALTAAPALAFPCRPE